MISIGATSSAFSWRVRSRNGPRCDATETDADGERILQLLMHAFPSST